MFLYESVVDQSLMERSFEQVTRGRKRLEG